MMADVHKRVAVVIVNFNGGEHIIRCLDALNQQTVSPDEIVVVDNNSSDDSISQIKTGYPKVNIIELAENTGFAAANNVAFAEINDITWVALLNPDTIPFVDWLECLINAASSNSRCDAFASKLVSLKNKEVLDGSGDIYHVSGLSWRRHHGMSDESTSRAKYSDRVFSPCAAAALYKLESIEAVRGFDADYFCYNEDVDLMFRMRLNGARCEYIESSVVAHVGSGITGKDSDFAIYYGHRNLVWTYFKNMPGRLLIWYLPQHLLLNFVTIVRYVFKGRGKVILKSKWDAIKGLRQVISKRRDIQNNRKIDGSTLTADMTKGIFRPYLSRFR